MHFGLNDLSLCFLPEVVNGAVDLQFLVLGLLIDLNQSDYLCLLLCVFLSSQCIKSGLYLIGIYLIVLS